MGVPGLGMAAVPLMALIFGGKESSGILLIILCLADIFAVIYYKRHADWSQLIRLFPWAIVGIVLGAYFGNNINDQGFKMTMAIIIIVSLGIMVFLQKNHKNSLNSNIGIVATLGMLGGFTSMVGNLAGSIMALYFLAMGFKKNEYIGTTAWFFLVINWIKIPFHIWSWNTITLDTLLIDLISIPFILLGALIGGLIVHRIADNTYRTFIIIATFVAAIFMIL